MFTEIDHSKMAKVELSDHYPPPLPVAANAANSTTQ
jgi:hypothetical protein